jgi:hypothetical protein
MIRKKIDHNQARQCRIKGEVMFCVMRTIAGMALCLLCFSCIAFDSSMKFNDNGSGKFVIQYRVSQMLKNMGEKENPGAEPANPFPLSKQEVEKSLSNIPGVRLNSVTDWEDEQDVYVKIDLDFTSIEALQKAKMFDDMPISVTRDNGKTVFTQRISAGEAPADQESVDMMKSVFGGYKLDFSISAPKQVISNNIGTVSDDKKTVTYSISLVELMQLKEKTELVITW